MATYVTMPRAGGAPHGLEPPGGKANDIEGLDVWSRNCMISLRLEPPGGKANDIEGLDVWSRNCMISLRLEPPGGKANDIEGLDVWSRNYMISLKKLFYARFTCPKIAAG